jgi:hypothetical protein
MNNLAAQTRIGVSKKPEIYALILLQFIPTIDA